MGSAEWIFRWLNPIHGSAKAVRGVHRAVNHSVDAVNDSMDAVSHKVDALAHSPDAVKHSLNARNHFPDAVNHSANAVNHSANAVNRSARDQHVAEILLPDVRDVAVLGGVADRDEEKRFLVLRAAEDFAEEAHRAGGVGEGGEAGGVQRGQEEAAGDADGLVDVVVGDVAALGVDAVAIGLIGRMGGRVPSVL
jgi:hypothetical protein